MRTIYDIKHELNRWQEQADYISETQPRKLLRLVAGWIDKEITKEIRYKFFAWVWGECHTGQFDAWQVYAVLSWARPTVIRNEAGDAKDWTVAQEAYNDLVLIRDTWQQLQERNEYSGS